MSPLNWNWVRWLLGVGGADIPPDAEIRWTWTNLPQSWRVFVVLMGVAALVYGALFLYRRDALQLAPRARRLLAGLRISVIVLLAIVALGPALAFTHLRTLEPVVVVLRDSSQSMANADPLDDPGQLAAVSAAVGRSAAALRSQPPTRAEIVSGLLAQSGGEWTDTLRRRGQLRVLDFAESVRSVELLPARSAAAEGTAAVQEHTETAPAAASALPPLIASGVGTNLHHALTEALSERLTAAVVLLTDGQHTDRATGKDDLLAMASQARARGVPLLIVGLGDPQPPRNLQIADVSADAQAWKDDPFELQALLRSEGIGGETVRVELLEQRIDAETGRLAGEQVLETRDVLLPPQGGQVRLSFQHTPHAAGRFAFSARVQPVAGEAHTDDNQPRVPAEVKVIDERARVLLVAGRAHWDYRFVRQVLEREKSIDLSCWLQSLDPDRAQEGDTAITQLPRTTAELFAYDVILLLDPDPREFDEAWIARLTEFVGDHAGGLLFMAGPAFASRFVTGPQTGDIRKLLPVRFGDTAAADVSSLLESSDHEWPLGIVEANLDQPLMRFDADPLRSRQTWQSLPGCMWSFPVQSAQPTARVLLEHTDPALGQLAGPRPLLVTGQFGAGHTVFLGLDGTWRWRQAGRNAEFFNRFWLQATRYLVEGRAVEGKRRGTIETDRGRYEIGDRITVQARLADAQFQPLEAPAVRARLEVAGRDAEPVTLRPVPQQPGRYEATIAAQHVGRHVLQVTWEDTTATPHVETTFSVSPPSAEFARTWQDRPLLAELATASGGRYFRIDEVSELAAAIPDKHQTLRVQGKPIPLWDTSRLLLLVVCLLTLEWALRKRFKLL